MFSRVRFFSICFFLITVGILGCSSEQEIVERKQLFDLNWKFHRGELSAAFEVDFNDKQWKSIDLPHDWSSERKLNQEKKGEISTSEDAIGWYRKKFNIPSDWQNMRVTVLFENDQLNAVVYINGVLLGENSDSLGSFLFDLTPYLKFDKENIIAVQVDHTDQNYEHSMKDTGITEHVWLLLSDPVSLKQ